jgi:hypothetical protein
MRSKGKKSRRIPRKERRVKLNGIEGRLKTKMPQSPMPDGKTPCIRPNPCSLSNKCKNRRGRIYTSRTDYYLCVYYIAPGYEHLLGKSSEQSE